MRASCSTTAATAASYTCGGSNFYLLLSTTAMLYTISYTTHVLFVYDILFKVYTWFISMPGIPTRYNDSGDKCYKNIQKVQEKRQLQQTTELCITGLWTGAGVWQTVHYLLPSWGQAGPKQSGQEGWLLQDTRLLNTANIIWGALLSAAVVPPISVSCAFSSYHFHIIRFCAW